MKSLYLLFTLFLLPSLIFSQWNSNPSVNTLVANSKAYETNPVSVSDGSGGSILFFSDGKKIWCRKINDAGNLLWGTAQSPVLINNTTDLNVYDLTAMPDGSGGAFVCFLYNEPFSDFAGIMLQHINSSGVLLYGAGGLVVTNAEGQDNYLQSLCPDGAGGVIIGWTIDNYENDTQVFAQRYNATGTALWAAGGIKVCTAPGFRAGMLVPDGSNGAIAFFSDTRNDAHGTDYQYLNDNGVANTDLYAQRLNASGQKLWAANGVAVCTAPNNIYLYPPKSATTDASGNVIITYSDGRNSTFNDDDEETNVDIYAQKLNSNGSPQWTANGVAIATQQGNQQPVRLVSDGAGGAVLLYSVDELGENFRVQRITSGGSTAWAGQGLALPANVGNGISPSLEADGLGNAVYTLITASNSTNVLKAQKLNAAGAAQWGAQGTVVCNALPYSTPAITASTNGSVIIGWGDSRNSAATGADIYASKVLADGSLAGLAVASEYISAANGNWNTPATWAGGVVPPTGAIVIVRHLVTVNVNISCYSLKVEKPSGQIKVNPNMVVNITH